jgi:hypothetical protein
VLEREANLLDGVRSDWLGPTQDQYPWSNVIEITFDVHDPNQKVQVPVERSFCFGRIHVAKPRRMIRVFVTTRKNNEPSYSFHSPWHPDCCQRPWARAVFFLAMRQAMKSAIQDGKQRKICWTRDQLRKRFQTLALETHPDTATGCKDEFKRYRAAYERAVAFLDS